MGKTTKAPTTEGGDKKKSNKKDGPQAARRKKASAFTTAAHKARRAKLYAAKAPKRADRRTAIAIREFNRLGVPADARALILLKFAHRPTRNLARSIHRHIKAIRLKAALIPLPPAAAKVQQ